MMWQRTALVTLCTAIAGAACSDPTGPCDARHACEVSGVDLAIIDSRIVHGERIGTDHVTGYPIYKPGPVGVEFTVVNRGDSTSAAQPVAGSADRLPPLRPGETARVVIIEDYTDQIHLHRSWDPSPVDARRADERTIYTELRQRPDSPTWPSEWPLFDTDTSNNSATSRPFHVAMPVLRGTLAEKPAVRAGMPFVTSFRLENVSVHGANAAPFDVVLCLWDFDLGCYGDWWTFFGRFGVPGMDAGSRYENAYLATLPHSAMVNPADAGPAYLSLCIVTADHESQYLPVPPTSCIASAGETFVRPNYQLCDTTPVQLGVAMTVTTADCGDLQSSRSWRRFAVLTLDAVAGATYDVNGGIGVISVRNADGEAADLPGPGLSFAETGTYFILVSTANGPVTMTISQE
ncbi:MAG: hypothetical protein KFH98_08615 [Gemmatimonadetes bacterium]|nr:hypothetical protein [Gemmatimonadota bacterium]